MNLGSLTGWIPGVQPSKNKTKRKKPKDVKQRNIEKYFDGSN